MGVVISIYTSDTCPKRTCTRCLLQIGTVYSYEADFALSNACYYNDYTTARLAIECGADINTSEGFPLFSAIENNNYKLTKMLLEKGAKANIINRQQPKTIYPLAAAILSNNLKFNSMGLYLNTPFINSIDEKVKIVDILLSYGAIPDKKRLQIYILELLTKQNNPSITRLVTQKIDMSLNDIDYPKLIETAILRENHNTAGFIRSFYKQKKNPSCTYNILFKKESTNISTSLLTEHTPLINFIK